LSKWQYLKDLVPDDAAFEEAKTQIKNLAWWDDAKTAGADLPMSPEVYHLHPLVFTLNINDVISMHQLVTISQLSKIMSNATLARVRQFHRAINTTLKEFEINTPIRIAHFLGQISHETADLLYLEEIQVFSGDREKFKGRGLIQLTHRETYSEFQKYINRNFEAYKGTNLLNNPELLSSDIFLSVLSSGWFWSEYKSNILKYSDRDDIYWVSVKVNGRKAQDSPYYSDKSREPNHMKERIESLNKSKLALGL